jgi:Fur family transcriptional regulator, stress-responsive regulator
MTIILVPGPAPGPSGFVRALKAACGFGGSHKAEGGGGIRSDVGSSLDLGSIHPVQSDLAALLKDKGVYVTAQRLAVMRALQASPHATADRVLADVRSEIGTISRQAVYDALNTLTRLGVVRRIEPSGSSARYETRAGDNHHHVVCRACGRIEDVDCAVGHRPCLDASETHGFTLDEAEVVYWGYCPECRTTSMANGSMANGSNTTEASASTTSEQHIGHAPRKGNP